MIESITKISNIYALIAFIVIAVLAVVFLCVGLFFILKKVGKFQFKKGDTEITFDNQVDVSGSQSMPSFEPMKNMIVEAPVKEVKFSCVTRTLTEHPFFSDMVKWEKRDIKHLHIKSEKKKLVVVEFLQIKFRTFREMLKNYVIEAEMLLNVGHDFKCDDILRLFWEGIDRYNNEARNHEIRLNGRVMTGIPEMFLERFDKWHTPHIDMINDAIKQIVNNEIYPDEYVKLLAIIEIFYIAFKLTILDAVGSINELNGELERLLEEKLGA